MPSRARKVLMVFDVPTVPVVDDHRIYLQQREWRDEMEATHALEKRGYEVDVIGIYNDLTPLLRKLNSATYQVIFFLAECFNNEREGAAHLAGTLEMLQVPFTGPGAATLRLCQDKGLSKIVLKQFNIDVPAFIISQRRQPLRKVKNFPYPCIVKPLGEEGSEGLSLTSVVHNEDDCLERIKFVHDRYQADVIVEEFIPGRDIYVGIIGNEKLTVFPPQELHFKNPKSELESFATWKTKWDPQYRKKWGISSRSARNLSEPISRDIIEISKKIYKALNLRGYARLDLRLRKDGRLFFLEANPNPSIARDDEFAKSARAAGMTYEDLISQIIKLAS